jgi:hypothetical protein
MHCTRGHAGLLGQQPLAQSLYGYYRCVGITADVLVDRVLPCRGPGVASLKVISFGCTYPRSCTYPRMMSRSECRAMPHMQPGCDNAQGIPHVFCYSPAICTSHQAQPCALAALRSAGALNSGPWRVRALHLYWAEWVCQNTYGSIEAYSMVRCRQPPACSRALMCAAVSWLTRDICAASPHIQVNVHAPFQACPDNTPQRLRTIEWSGRTCTLTCTVAALGNALISRCTCDRNKQG